MPDDRTRIADVAHRQRTRVAGRVSSVRVQPQAGVSALECTLTDETGGLVLVFLGRKSIAGMAVGTRLVATGVVGDHRGHLAMLNPTYEILPD